ncbi:uncharacterized protein GGS25DRAFT_448884 [Hypoxylon fragiforme]|uniref:uncharacterized protein n=1 Tax=Hypoxylon fragiforme TaxID=63214 RepID=UPI0020C7034A|nr:uncharacterized protein GGS25DRAFT_448884 [Hypoxylon fragiforme]KAI2604123.1 hypothetical protein GGS25DRAFT_448884 [Hypoxylon fragiforme]
MSGVRNLRAMFEQRGENNPPDRGRSPGSPSPTDSPRPLSKVRTTFVAVEKDGILGLRRQHSGDSASVESGKESIETEPITSQPVSEKPDTVMENMARNISALKLNLSREGSVDSPRNSPRLAPAPQFSMKKDLESPGLAPNPNPDKTTDEEDTKAKLLPADPTEKAAIRGKGVTSPGSASGPTSIGKPKTAVTKAAPKTAPISISAKSVSSAPRSPNFTKAGTSTPKASGRSSNLAPKKAVSAPSSDHEGSKKSSIPAAVRTSKKPAPVELPPLSLPGNLSHEPRPTAVSTDLPARTGHLAERALQPLPQRPRP